MASRKLSDLCPEMQEIAQEFLDQCKEAKIDVLIYCTYRSNAEQDADYASSRPPLNGAWKTDKKGGQSAHNALNSDGLPASQAFDCVPCLNGKPQWKNISSYEKMGEIGEGLGLTWGGRWQHKDLVHFQLTKTYP